jgi:hypothetical protein
LVLPSKKLIPIITACIVGLGVISFALFYHPKAKIVDPLQTLSAVSQTESIQNQILDQDADGDGLKDWEETLWGSDPKKADTDGDGTKDGEEVKLGRNPSIKGPKDIVDTKTAIKASADSSVTTKRVVTPTDLLARDILAKYMEAKQTGAELPDGIENQIVQSVIANNSFSAGTLPKIYSQSSLKTFNSNTSNDFKTYGNTLGSIIKENSVSSENELLILEKAIQTQDKQALAKLDIIIASYRNIVKELLAVSVPTTAAEFHADLINGFNAAIASDEDMKKLFDDPIVALYSTQSYQKAVIDISDSMRSMYLLFQARGVEYTNSEPGYVFTHAL